MNKIDLSPGIKDPLCGWVWAKEHQDDPYPSCCIELVTPSGRYTMIVKGADTLNKVMKALK